MKASQLGQLGRLLALTWAEFKKRGGATDVEGESTSELLVIDGLPVQVIVTIKLVPWHQSKAA